jgi:asparagine synthase (glutamine-hydrolysing)
MCGFTGFISSSNTVAFANWPTLLTEMGNAIRHRGPDDSGVWLDVDAGVGLSHRRLSILDLSPAGHQPMRSASGRFVIAFNGEIYNHLEIRAELNCSLAWRGHSDTETLLAGFDAWGIEDTIIKSIGMFAMVVWDKKNRTLTLIRDRLGEKPLYYGWQGNTFLFGSDLKALKVHPEFEAEIDRNAIGLLMRHSCIPAPYSIYKNIKKLLPGSHLTISLQNRDAPVVRYWDARKIVAEGHLNPFMGTEGEAVDVLEQLLLRAVGRQMMSDVPLGAFLSGGIDSTTIVALMQAQSSQPIQTYTIGFDQAGYNEAIHAKAVAKHLGTKHTELYVDSRQAMDVIPRLTELFSEPFSDSSQIPTFLVSQLARQQVTVSLSGDGGDELFGGYSSYFKYSKINKKLSLFLGSISSVLCRIISSCPPPLWESLFSPFQQFIPANIFGNIIHKPHFIADALKARSVSEAELYHFVSSHWRRPNELVYDCARMATVFTEHSLQPKTDNFISKMMAIDMLSYLPDDILTKVDRAAMAVSLETRVPLLDHQLVEFAWRLPIAYRIHKGVGKWPLKQVLLKYVPQQLIERPKMGFGIPLDGWLRGPLREWSEELLSESRLQQQGYLNPLPIRKKWAEHLSGKTDWQAHLWDILMFQAWLEAEKK